MRFLTAYFAIQEGCEVLLTGSSRMKERPIQVLVDALRQLGADITYEEKEGFPPLRIKGSRNISEDNIGK
jgi:3-phosphoshikimate 1-carboxyvinyltransferase